MTFKDVRKAQMRSMIVEIMEFSDDPQRKLFEWVQAHKISLEEFKELLEYA